MSQIQKVKTGEPKSIGLNRRAKIKRSKRERNIQNV